MITQADGGRGTATSLRDHEPAGPVPDGERGSDWPEGPGASSRPSGKHVKAEPPAPTTRQRARPRTRDTTTRSSDEVPAEHAYEPGPVRRPDRGGAQRDHGRARRVHGC